MQDATQLALKIVTNYALSDIGITTYAPPGTTLGYMRKSFEVNNTYLNAIPLLCVVAGNLHTLSLSTVCAMCNQPHDLCLCTWLSEPTHR